MSFVRRQLAGPLLAVLVCSVALGGCTTARNLLNTGASQCFRSVPPARAAVGAHPRFTGVLRMQGRSVDEVIEASAGKPAPPVALEGFSRKALCVVGYEGTFRLDDVRRGWAVAAPGPYRSAAVVVDPANNQVLVTLLYRRFPRSLRFRTLL